MSDYLNKLKGMGFIKEENPNRVPTAYTLDLGHNRHFVLEWPGTKYQRGFFIENYGEENSEITYCLDGFDYSIERILNKHNPQKSECITYEYLLSLGFFADEFTELFTFATINPHIYICVERNYFGIDNIEYKYDNKTIEIKKEDNARSIFFSRENFDEIFEKIKSKV